VAELVARLLATGTAAPEISLKIQNIKHNIKQRSGQQHSSPPKKYTKKLFTSNLRMSLEKKHGRSLFAVIGSTSTLNTNVRKI
jgi:hypothetical protein